MTGENITFSILVPAYNAGATLARTLDSLLAQTYDNWECVIVDDGSRDDTSVVAQAYCQNDLRFSCLWQENAGTASALNTAVNASSGQFLVQLGADDELLSGYCMKTNELIKQNPAFDIYAANAWQVFAGGKRRLFNSGVRFESQATLHLEDIVERPSIYGTAAIRRETFQGVGGFRPHIYNEDYDFWLRALANGARHIYQAETLSLYHVSPTQKTSDHLCARKSDYELFEDLATNGCLTDEQIALVREKQASIRKNIAHRTLLYRFFGKSMSEKIIAAMRSSNKKSHQ